MASSAEQQAVTNFRDYLRINTAQPDPDYASAAVFLKKYAGELELSCDVIEIVAGKPIVLMTWLGKDPSLPSLLLNSHIDVVPASPEHWKHPPFEAVKEENGDIYGRGTQDMKSVGIQYLEAIRCLKKQGKQFLRTIHVSFVPDEELGGFDGMKAYVKTSHFQALNVGFVLDEGLASPTDVFHVFNGERTAGLLFIFCAGNPGRSWQFTRNTAAQKLAKLLDLVMSYRAEQEELLRSDPALKLGDVTTINLAIVRGGEQGVSGEGPVTVQPAEIYAEFNFRVTPRQSYAEFAAMVDRWCAEAGVTSIMKAKTTSTYDAKTIVSTSNKNPWWKALSNTLQEQGCKIETEIFSAATDSCYLRELGYPALGFSPMNHTPVLLHDHNEFLNEDVFLKGIRVYCHLIPALADVPPMENDDIELFEETQSHTT